MKSELALTQSDKKEQSSAPAASSVREQHANMRKDWPLLRESVVSGRPLGERLRC